MSRIGAKPIPIPSNVKISQASDGLLVQGPKGELKQFNLEGLSYKMTDGQCLVERLDNQAHHRARHGLMRSLLANMVTGVSQGFEKNLELVGIGYKVRLEGQNLILNLGFSHEVIFKIPDMIEITVNGMIIKVQGIDKQQVGQTAAMIRNLKKPEPYKGKGIRYQNEVVRRKAGKGGKEA